MLSEHNQLLTKYSTKCHSYFPSDTKKTFLTTPQKNDPAYICTQYDEHNPRVEYKVKHLIQILTRFLFSVARDLFLEKLKNENR